MAELPIIATSGRKKIITLWTEINVPEEVEILAAEKELDGLDEQFSSDMISDEDLNNFFDNLKYKAVCLNDDEAINEEQFEKMKKQLNESFSKILPNKSSFEK